MQPNTGSHRGGTVGRRETYRNLPNLDLGFFEDFSMSMTMNTSASPIGITTASPATIARTISSWNRSPPIG